MQNGRSGWLRFAAAVAAVGTVFAALLWARLAPGPDFRDRLPELLEPEEKLVPRDGGLWAIHGNNDTTAYVAVEEAQGYGGPLAVAVRANADGEVAEVRILAHAESPGFLTAVEGAGLVAALSGRPVNSPFTVGDDVDAVTGATITSQGVARATQGAAHRLAQQVFQLPVPQTPALAGMAPEDWAMVGMVALSVICWWRRWHRVRLAVLTLCTVVLGFWLGAQATTQHLAALALGYAPSPAENPGWYIPVGAFLILTALCGRGWYCYWFCPFGGVQEWLGRVGRGLIRPSHRVRRTLAGIRWVVLWGSAVVGFLLRNPGAGSVEPFGTLFQMKGTPVQWLLLVTVLVAAVFFERFWCSLFCPMGALRELLERGRREVMRRWQAGKAARPGTGASEADSTPETLS